MVLKVLQCVLVNSVGVLTCVSCLTSVSCVFFYA